MVERNQKDQMKSDTERIGAPAVAVQRSVRPPINIAPPICLCGFTADGRMVLGGAFQLADTMGVPLWFSLDQAEENQCVISMPHYFASAMEHGWDDVQTFGKIRESLADRGSVHDLERIKLGCIAMFMDVAHTMPGQPANEIGRRMRELIEADALTHAMVEVRLTPTCNKKPSVTRIGQTAYATAPMSSKRQ